MGTDSLVVVAAPATLLRMKLSRHVVEVVDHVAVFVLLANMHSGSEHQCRTPRDGQMGDVFEEIWRQFCTLPFS